MEIESKTIFHDEEPPELTAPMAHIELTRVRVTLKSECAGHENTYNVSADGGVNVMSTQERTNDNPGLAIGDLNLGFIEATGTDIDELERFAFALKDMTSEELERVSTHIQAGFEWNLTLTGEMEKEPCEPGPCSGHPDLSSHDQPSFILRLSGNDNSVRVGDSPVHDLLGCHTVKSHPYALAPNACSLYGCGVTPGASILHADLDSFYASVEQRDDPKLRDRPVIVGEGVVLAASYEAKVFGVRSAMNGSQARLLCPHAVVVPPRMEAYSEASKAVFAVFDDFTPLVEALSPDEAFLDVSGAVNLLGSPARIAADLRKRVRADIGLAISVGVARTKFLAKVASAQAKPDGVIVVEPRHEREFLHPLPVEVLWGVGPVTSAKLRNHGVETVGDLAAAGGPELQGLLGPHAGRHLRALAHNRDPRPVDTKRKDRSMGAQRALGNKRRTREELRRELLALTEKVAGRLRKAERLTRTVTVRYRTSEMCHESRSRTLAEASASTELLTATADELLLALVDGPQGPGSRLGRIGCSLIGITFSALVRPDAVQLALRFPEEGRSIDLLDVAVDDIRRRWGREAVARASLLEHDGPLPTLGRPTALDS